MTDRLVLDYGHMLAPSLGGRGLDPESLAAAADRFVETHARVEERRAAGELGFFALPYETQTLGEIRAFADGIGQAFDTVVVLGIGGSGLGTSALRQALLSPFWNELDDEARDYFPRLYVVDNLDPGTFSALLDRIDIRRTLFDVVSKSGATSETMAQYLVVREALESALEGEDGARRHLLFTTDPEAGALRAVAEREGIATLPIPPNVGGRFSVFSAVGLLPAALVGIDVEGILAGARAMDERCRTDELSRNPAGLFATLQHRAHAEAGAGVHVMMAYADGLFGVADWFRQLWAESLGKRLDVRGAEVFAGPTPVKALGPADQHSQVQLYMEGPFDKTVTFLTVRDVAADVPLPAAGEDLGELAYLGGHTMGELVRAEQQATALALARAGRMNMTLELPRLDAHAIGEVLMLLQVATLYAGDLYGVNPLDQPGVELGKRLTYGLMGRPGYEAPSSTSPDPRWVNR